MDSKRHCARQHPVRTPSQQAEVQQRSGGMRTNTGSQDPGRRGYDRNRREGTLRYMHKFSGSSSSQNSAFIFLQLGPATVQTYVILPM